MADQELVNYIKRRLSNGDGKVAITKALAEVGWPAADIDEAFFFLNQEGEYAIGNEGKVTQNEGHKASKPKEILIISVSLLALAAVVYALHLMGIF